MSCGEVYEKDVGPRSINYMFIKPSIVSPPSCGLSIPTRILDMTSSQKFADMYNAPSPNCNKFTKQFEGVVDALLGINFAVREIHQLMKLLSAIANLEQMEVREEVASERTQEVMYQLKTKKSKSNPNAK